MKPYCFTRRRAVSMACILLRAAALGSLFFLSGCASHPSLVGKWSGSLSANGQTVPQEIEYKPDGTLLQTLAGGKVSATGTYPIKDDTLTMTPTGATISGRTIPLPPQAKVPQVVKYQLSGDTLTLTTGATQLSLKREK